MLNQKYLEKLSKMANVDYNELDFCNKAASTRKEYLGKIVAENEIMNENDFQQYLAKLLGLPFVNEFKPLPEEVFEYFLTTVPYRLASNHLVFPHDFKNNTIILAVINPWEVSFLEEVAQKMGYTMEVVLTTRSIMQTKLQVIYERRQGTAEEAAEAFGEDDEFKNLMDLKLDDNEDLLDSNDEEPIKRLVNSILFQALRDKSSDIHADPSEQDTIVRQRVDGVLHQVTKVPKHGHMPLINRIKVMAGLDISTKNRPQDGRTVIKLGGKKVDIRVSVLPTVHGERAVLRLLTTSNTVLTVEDLGFSEAMKKKLLEVINLPHGIFLVTGPTGSGKTTTLYASLGYLDRDRKNIVTIEDPVEYQIPGYGQVQVQEKVGMTFSAGLRSILRQDPDVIMVGEIRDSETAQIAIQSALTGHMVFSTLHTNDTCSTIVRLVDMSIEPYLVSSSLKGILAQRLVRKICDKCKVEMKIDWSELEAAGFHSGYKKYFKGHLWKGSGCSSCLHTGFSGRVGLFEFLHINDEVKRQIVLNPDAVAIKEVAEKKGLIAMKDDGMYKVMIGKTTLDEMLRVVSESE